MARWLLMLLLVSSSLQAATSDWVDYRNEVMEGASRHLKAIRFLAFQDIPLIAQAEEHGRALVAFSAMLPELFPRGSVDSFSEATPEVWTRWDEFLGKARDLEREARTISAAARAHDVVALQQAYRRTLGACKSCHEAFRSR